MVDLKSQYARLKPEIDAAVQRVLESSQFILGDEVAAFEKEFSSLCGASQGIGVNSGTSALHLALLAAGVGPGDEVITVPFTFVATVGAITYTGARPVFADIDPRSYTLDPAQLEKAITPRTKAVIPVHLYGHPADMDPILEIARRRKLIVIEDAAQAHAAEYKGKRTGGLGDMGCFSFYPTKNLGAYGEGGMVVTSNDEFAKKIRSLRDWGQERRYHHVLKGFNMRLEGIQGAILRVKLRYLQEWTAARRAHAARYSELLQAAGIAGPTPMPWAKHVFHVYPVRIPNRDAVHKGMNARGIGTGTHYPIPMHLQPIYAELGYKSGAFPHAEKAAAEEISLPIFPELTAAHIGEVIGALTELLK